MNQSAVLGRGPLCDILFREHPASFFSLIGLSGSHFQHRSDPDRHPAFLLRRVRTDSNFFFLYQSEFYLKSTSFNVFIRRRLPRSWLKWHRESIMGKFPDCHTPFREWMQVCVGGSSNFTATYLSIHDSQKRTRRNNLNVLPLFQQQQMVIARYDVFRIRLVRCFQNAIVIRVLFDDLHVYSRGYNFECIDERTHDFVDLECAQTEFRSR